MLAILKVVAVKKKESEAATYFKRPLLLRLLQLWERCAIVVTLGCRCKNFLNLKLLLHPDSEGRIQLLRVPNFTQLTPPPLRVDNCGRFTWYLPFVTWPSMDFIQTPPPLLVHVVIEWPLTAAARCSRANCFRRLTWFHIEHQYGQFSQTPYQVAFLLNKIFHGLSTVASIV